MWSHFTKVSVLVGVLGLFGLAGCGPINTSADNAMAYKQEQLQNEEVKQVGMPNITNFTEMKNLKYLYELRDQRHLMTYSYVMDMNGNLHHVCDSFGYGIPYSTQYDNPQKVVQDYAQSFGTLPQAEPNGLFPPTSANGTWVLCADPNSKQGFQPMYVEPNVIVSPWKLHSVSEWAVINTSTKTK